MFWIDIDMLFYFFRSEYFDYFLFFKKHNKRSYSEMNDDFDFLKVQRTLGGNSWLKFRLKIFKILLISKEKQLIFIVYGK